MSLTEEKNSLKKIVGIPGLAITVINFSIGAGIYAIPAIIGIQLGSAGITGLLFGAIMFAAIILCYVEIGSNIKVNGGSYAYVEAAFGPFAGFIVNWLFFFGWGILGDAAVMNVVADSLSVLAPSFQSPIMRSMLFLFLISSMVIVNVYNSKLSIRLVELITIVKLIPLLLLIIFGFGKIHPENLHWSNLPSFQHFDQTALIIFFAFAGFETSLNISGEIKNPERTIPRGIFAGGILVILIYILIQCVTYGILGPGISTFKDAPLAAVAEKIFGSRGSIFLLLAAALSGLASVSGDVLASSRLLYAGAIDGFFPKPLGKIHSKFGTPFWAVITYATLIFLLSISGGFKQLAVLASGALLLIYMAVVLAVIKFRFKKKIVKGSFKIPGGILVPCFALLTIAYVFSNLSYQEITSLLIFVLIVILFYYGMQKWKSREKV
jgi:APA family basic amino acid/polyamine antiporter